MAKYTAREWSNGDIVTANNLNHIEEGIENASSGGGALFVKYDRSETVDGVTTYYFDKTWQEVHDALVAGKAVTANVVIGPDDDLSVYEGALDYIIMADVDQNNKYVIESVLTKGGGAPAVPFVGLDSPNDYLRITHSNK